MPSHEWARPIDWESNRDVLTELYLGQGLTLEDVMQYSPSPSQIENPVMTMLTTSVVQTHHNFHAT